MVVEVRYFAVLRERRGREAERLELPEGLRVDELFSRLFPAEASGGLRVAFAVNQAYAPAGTVLEEGDEVAFIPPLGGG